MHNPKKRVTRRPIEQPLSHEKLERQLSSVAASLTAGQGSSDPAEHLQPCWIEPRQLIRILVPFVSMN